MSTEKFSSQKGGLMSLNIVIPTYKRADKLPGKDYFKAAKYVLPESQRDDYAAVLPGKRMIVIPDKSDGSIGKKRNWILQNIERPLLMLDDDVKALTTTQGIYDSDGQFQKTNQKVRLTPEQAENVILNGFNLADQWGCKLWGLNVNTDGRNYQQYKPFSLTQMVLGPFQGHLEHNLTMDERVGTCDDYDFSLQMLQKYGKILRLNKYAYDCVHGDNSGGIVSMRTNEIEIEYCKAIMKKWGTKIIKYRIPPEKPGDVLNASINVPIKGV